MRGRGGGGEGEGVVVVCLCLLINFLLNNSDNSIKCIPNLILFIIISF